MNVLIERLEDKFEGIFQKIKQNTKQMKNGRGKENEKNKRSDIRGPIFN